MKNSAPLSKAQYGLYVECMNHRGEVCYNVPFLYTFDGSLDGERLAKAIEEAVKVHPTLFTRIALGDDGEPVQTVDNDEIVNYQLSIINSLTSFPPTRLKPFTAASVSPLAMYC